MKLNNDIKKHLKNKYTCKYKEEIYSFVSVSWKKINKNRTVFSLGNKMQLRTPSSIFCSFSGKKINFLCGKLHVNHIEC